MRSRLSFTGITIVTVRATARNPRPRVGSAAMARPEVAVVVATHDRARRGGELVESLRRQTLQADRFEAVFVDDGSTDDTVAVLERERERGGLNMQVIALPDSAGPSRARNRGWRASSAPLVAFTDDDCLADPGWLEG